MKKIVLVFMLALVLIVAKAQDESPTLKGNKQLNIGAGIFGSGNSSLSIIPLHLGIDFFIVNNFSLGIDVNWRYYNKPAHQHNIFSAQAVADYHFNELMMMPNSWDFYAGIKAGPGYMTDPDDWGDLFEKGVKFVFDARAGIRYYITDNLSLNSEIGVQSIGGTQTSGITLLVGITTKL